MKELPLSVAISALINKDKILLIKRIKGDYIGYWGLPGGKIEKDEHVSEAAVREIIEESGIDSDFKSHLGIVSEHLIEDDRVMQHFLLHVCELEPKSVVITNGTEGRLKWFDINRLNEQNEKIIPSDYHMIEKMVLDRNNKYYECVVEKNGEKHVLKKFE